MDSCVQIAVNLLNSNPNILPNTTIKIKRFNDFDSKFPSSLGAGYAAQVAMDIHQNHQDVVAVFGDIYADVTSIGYISRVRIGLRRSFEMCGIQVVTQSRVKENMPVAAIEEIGSTLAYYDVRYIILDAGSLINGQIYFTLAAKGMSFGPGYVWIGTSKPFTIENGVELLGPTYSDSLIKDFNFIFKLNLDQPYMDTMYNDFLDVVNTWTLQIK
ncbi:UNVERIFIED_CONTAM: hypothetical protein HDU68_010242 [Siphonaria sp. JEL0065]|nr:hypothetical protein HDU68_010242 [Siphonaria sp. JEL0065]